jgi:BMFP domain-containing protein YqiC
MRETRGRVFDDFTRLMGDAAGMAQGVRREFEQVVKGQFERWLSTLDVVSREEFEAVKEMAARARDENDKLEARLAALEAKLGGTQNAPSGMGDSTD